MTIADLKLLTKAIAPVLKELVAKRLGEQADDLRRRGEHLVATIADVQTRVLELEFDRVRRLEADRSHRGPLRRGRSQHGHQQRPYEALADDLRAAARRAVAAARRQCVVH